MDDLIHLAAIEALEEAEILAQQPERRFHACDNPFDDLSEWKFVKRYRLSKAMTADLITLLEPHLIAPSRVSALSVQKKVLTALKFFATGSYQDDIGDNINHAISQSSVSRSIKEVTEALNLPEIFNDRVRLPVNLQELREKRNQYNFPGVIGCVDCTHIAIYPPQVQDILYPEHIYVNRKGYHSINTQLICDANAKILNVSARYPGSSHDSYIWNNSNALVYMQQLNRNNHRSFYLLGDSGYALRPWLLTPIANAAPDSPEERYNQLQSSTRSVIERCNGILKLRFRCLLKHRVLHYSPESASKIINSCTILHNLCVDNNIPPIQLGDDIGDENLRMEDIDFGMYEPENVGEPIIVGRHRVNPELVAGRQLQQYLIRTRFAH